MLSLLPLTRATRTALVQFLTYSRLDTPARDLPIIAVVRLESRSCSLVSVASAGAVKHGRKVKITKPPVYSPYTYGSLSTNLPCTTRPPYSSLRLASSSIASCRQFWKKISSTNTISDPVRIGNSRVGGRGKTFRSRILRNLHKKVRKRRLSPI